jgi:aarF domain-containing kinase
MFQLLEEIEKQFQTEFDYRKEAENPIASETIIKAGLAGPGKLCQIPKPYMELCTKRVLVMEELHGGKQSHSRRILGNTRLVRGRV